MWSCASSGRSFVALATLFSCEAAYETTPKKAEHASDNAAEGKCQTTTYQGSDEQTQPNPGPRADQRAENYISGHALLRDGALFGRQDLICSSGKVAFLVVLAHAREKRHNKLVVIEFGQQVQTGRTSRQETAADLVTPGIRRLDGRALPSRSGQHCTVIRT
jgi:hypothetical protein